MAREPGPAISIIRQAVIATILVAVSAGVWMGGGATLGLLGVGAQEDSGRSRRERGAIPVITAEVTSARDDLSIQLVGTGRAERSVTLRGEAEGRIVELALSAGARFSKGDALLELESSDEQLAVSLAEARSREAERVLLRYERLQGSGAAATATLDDAATQAEVARIELSRARQVLDKRTLLAPFDGVAGFPAVEAGDWLRAGDTVATYDDRSRILVEVEMPETVLARLELGQSVIAETPAYRDRAFEGQIIGVDSRVDPATRAARVRVGLENGEDLLRPGASFTIRFDLEGGEFPVAPELALQFSRGSLFVWRIRDEKAEKVEVRLVRRRAGAVLIEGGLEPGDRVVVEGAQRLAEGRSVRVLAAPGEGS